MTTSYLTQAALGQADLLLRARPLEVVLQDQSVPAYVKSFLQEVPAMKEFAISMGLTPTKSYTKYVAIDRKSVTWVVSACNALAFEPKLYTFPFVGSVPYLGFFHEEDALSYFRKLSLDTSLDVSMRPVPAYSTLGWFSDPIVSSMIQGSDFATVLFHESLHATVYIKNQSLFNESLAEFVAGILTEKYIIKKHGERSVALDEYHARISKRAQATRFLYASYQELEQIYRLQKDVLAQKEKILQKIDVYFGFHGEKHLYNNASLMQFVSYNSGEVVFEALFARAHHELVPFLEMMRHVSFTRDQEKDLTYLVTGQPKNH